MARFATGKNAYAISDRSGFRYKYKDMRKEWTGALVGRDEYESKQPQLGPFQKVVDAQALKDARPDRTEPVQVYVGVPIVEIPSNLVIPAYGILGVVEVNTT